ncbi:PDZ domain-containing protein [Kitasatospora purpeofusca]|uniref:PDZ domain-containing protein n=1 Tax=Kitasatospora purpeofusca TaxID=67352 RepID=UPI003659A6E6
MHRSGEVRTIIGLTAAALLAGVLPATAHAAGPGPSGKAVERRIPPQQNVPELDAPGEAKAVTFPPDNLTRRGPGTFVVAAPPHTRITLLDLHCVPVANCPVTLADDGSTATARLRPGHWSFTSPIHVHLQARPDAPLPRAEYNGSFTADGESRPLTVVITAGRQGGLGLTSTDAPAGSGALVATTVPGGPADTAGIRVGDTITSLNNTPVTNAAELRDARLGKLRAGATVPVTYRQPGGTTRTTQVTLS